MKQRGNNILKNSVLQSTPFSSKISPQNIQFCKVATSSSFTTLAQWVEVQQFLVGCWPQWLAVTKVGPEGGRALSPCLLRPETHFPAMLQQFLSEFSWKFPSSLLSINQSCELLWRSCVFFCLFVGLFVLTNGFKTHWRLKIFNGSENLVAEVLRLWMWELV